MFEDKYTNILKEMLDKKRFNHSIRTKEKAIELAKIHNAPIQEVLIGAYLHDIGSFFTIEEALSYIDDKYLDILTEDFRTVNFLHGFAGAGYIEKNYEIFGIDNKDILNGIRYHTIGKKNMNIIEKIIYISDAIEDGRDYEGVNKIRELANTDIDDAIILEIKYKMHNLIDRDVFIHKNNIELYNQLLKEKNKVKIKKVRIKGED